MEFNPRELNTKYVCSLAFIVCYKVCIVTIIASEISSVFIIIDINLLIQ